MTNFEAAVLPQRIITSKKKKPTLGANRNHSPFFPGFVETDANISRNISSLSQRFLRAPSRVVDHKFDRWNRISLFADSNSYSRHFCSSSREIRNYSCGNYVRITVGWELPVAVCLSFSREMVRYARWFMTSLSPTLYLSICQAQPGEPKWTRLFPILSNNCRRVKENRLSLSFMLIFFHPVD